MKNHSILVIDDKPSNFEVVETLLEPENYNVYYASNGREALANLDAFNPDVILLDLMMPEIDGLEVCQRIRVMRKWRAVPIVIVTSASSKSILAQCLDAGADDFINKPVDGLELRARVKSMLRTKKQFDRIESLLKLQQNSISSLENDFSKLTTDLVMSFADEMHTPVINIQEQLADLRAKLNNFNESQILDLVDLASKSAENIQRATYKFWTYLDFTAEKKQLSNNESCNIQEIAEQVALAQVQGSVQQRYLSIDLERAEIAVSTKHCELIIRELLDNAWKVSEPGTQIEVQGKVSNGTFHLWVKDSRADDINLVLNSIEPEDRELELSLKIVKKIVNIYDGYFAIHNNDRHQTTVYLKLPLARE